MEALEPSVWPRPQSIRSLIKFLGVGCQSRKKFATMTDCVASRPKYIPVISLGYTCRFDATNYHQEVDCPAHWAMYILLCIANVQ